MLTEVDNKPDKTSGLKSFYRERIRTYKKLKKIAGAPDRVQEVIDAYETELEKVYEWK